MNNGGSGEALSSLCILCKPMCRHLAKYWPVPATASNYGFPARTCTSGSNSCS